MRKIYHLLFILVIIFVVFSSCQNTIGTEIKRINLFNTKYIPDEKVATNEVYPKELPSYIFYRKYYIYFYDNSSKTLYKYSRNGNSVLTIQNSSMTVSGFGIDKEKMMKSLEEDQRTVKINRAFPLPEVTGISVDFNDNIYLKVIIKGSTGNSYNDCIGFLSNYSDQNHPIFYILDKDKDKDLVDNLNYFESISNKNNSNDNEKIKYYTFYMVFNQYGDFIKVLALSENHPSFPHNSNIFHTKEDLSEGSNKDGKKLDGTNYIQFILPTIYENTGLPSALANTTSLAYFIKFSLKSEENQNEILSLPHNLDVMNLNNEKNSNDSNGTQKNQNSTTQEESNITQIYYYPYQYCKNSIVLSFSLKDFEYPDKNYNLLASEFGSAVVTPEGFTGIQILYYDKGYILFDTLYRINFNNEKKLIELSYSKKLFNEKVENGVQKITLTVVDTPIGFSEGNLIFYIRYLEKLPTPTAKLIVKNVKGEQLLTRILKVKDILTSENLTVGENGSIYGFSKIKDKVYFFYFASEVAVSKLKVNN